MREDYAAHCLELLAPLGQPRARRMFGGHGLYVDELFIALIVDERLYLKVDDHSRAQFEAAACVPFTYPGRDGQRLVMSYYSAPEETLESPALMQPWARLALAAALRARTLKDNKASTKAAAKAPRKKAATRRAPRES